MEIAAVDLFAGYGGVNKGVDFSVSKYECECMDQVLMEMHEYYQEEKMRLLEDCLVNRL